MEKAKTFSFEEVLSSQGNQSPLSASCLMVLSKQCLGAGFRTPLRPLFNSFCLCISVSFSVLMIAKFHRLKYFTFEPHGSCHVFCLEMPECSWFALQITSNRPWFVSFAWNIIQNETHSFNRFLTYYLQVTKTLNFLQSFTSTRVWSCEVAKLSMPGISRYSFWRYCLKFWTTDTYTLDRCSFGVQYIPWDTFHRNAVLHGCFTVDTFSWDTSWSNSSPEIPVVLIPFASWWGLWTGPWSSDYWGNQTLGYEMIGLFFQMFYVKGSPHNLRYWKRIPKFPLALPASSHHM